LIKSSQLESQLGSMRRLNARLAARFEEALQTFVAKAFDHA
jgi:hypothetical protein